MKVRRMRISLAMCIIAAGIFVCFAALLRAEEQTASGQQIQEQKEQIKSNALSAREEEKSLLEQISQAEKSGDYQTARSLRQQLKTAHQENVEQKQQDRQDLKEARQELRSGMKEARFDKMDANDDGIINKAEHKAFNDNKPKFDKDNNPPGPKGGQGTNWENKPGPQGGPGASPNRKPLMRDKDNNPPGPKGGQGTNWENPPGPKGGPGATPNRRPRR